MSRLRRAPSSPLPGGEVWVNERAQRLLRPLTPSSLIVRGPDFNQGTMLGGSLAERQDSSTMALSISSLRMNTR